jgi:hypothetical protein
MYEPGDEGIRANSGEWGKTARRQNGRSDGEG